MPIVTGKWQRTAAWRGKVLFAMVIAQSILASVYFSDVLPHKGGTALETLILLLFAILFAWISIGFWTALMGFITLARGIDRYAITNSLRVGDNHLDPATRCAILLPVCNEDAKRVFAGLAAIYRSLVETGQLAHFDFFVLSDSSDPGKWVEEEVQWAALCRKVNGFGHVFYRRRRNNIKRKSGNVADFCRRWGANYECMIVLDADSIMSGATLLNLAQLMETHPDAGIIQTAPLLLNRESLIARVQQFANHAYGPMFAAGLNFWQLGDNNYWGHNAIIRIKPFMRHCALPRLPGKPPLGGDILSHDFVEAALMRKAGWTVWLAYDLGGSFEEAPPTLLDELKRDRRWCQGNLQHVKLLFTDGLRAGNRALFANGAMAYASALLWFLLLMLSTIEVVIETIRGPVYFSVTPSLFPQWPAWHPGLEIGLLSSTAVLLFLPKLLSIILVLLKHGQVRLFGGTLALVSSVLLEMLASTLLAPMRMIFHSKFVFLTLLGRTVRWDTQNRDDAETGWRDALQQHGYATLFAILWGAGVFALNEDFFWWLAPIVVSLILSIPISVYSSRVSLGRAAQRRKLFLNPNESHPPQELLWMHAGMAAGSETATMMSRDGFVQAIVDPYTHALHLSLLREHPNLPEATRERRAALCAKVLEEGSGALTASQRKELLYDTTSLHRLHHAVWSLDDATLARDWGLILPSIRQDSIAL